MDGRMCGCVDEDQQVTQGGDPRSPFSGARERVPTRANRMETATQTPGRSTLGCTGSNSLSLIHI
eukprot:3933594-Prorocentrum_lima.AAC.1